MMKGQIPKAVSSLDADLLVVGQIDAAYFNELADVGLVAYRADIQLKVIRLDTAQIVGTLAKEGKGNGFWHQCQCNRYP